MRIAENEVHIWKIRLNLPGPELAFDFESLCPQEKAKAAKLKNPLCRRNFVASHAALKRILAQYLRIPIQQIDFEVGEYGKPHICKDIKNDIDFNLTHSRDLALCAINQGANVGLDIEALRSVYQVEQVAQRFLSSEECEELELEPRTNRNRKFLELWTMKEAALKAQGIGLIGNLNQPMEALLKDLWRVHSFTVDDTYMGAICFANSKQKLSFHDFGNENA